MHLNIVTVAQLQIVPYDTFLSAMIGDSIAMRDIFNSLETDEKLELLFNKSLKWEEDGKNLGILIKETDQFFLIVIAIIIFFMQCGFAFLEAGSVR